MSRKNSHDISWSAIAKIIFAIVVLGGAYIGYSNYSQTGNPLVGSHASLNSNPTVPGNGKCPATPTLGFPQVQYSATYKNGTSGGQTSVSTTGNLIDLNLGQIVAQGNSIVGAITTYNSIGNCGDVVQLLAGDNKFIYAMLSNQTVLAGSQATPINIQNLQLEAAPSQVNFYNGSGNAVTPSLTGLGETPGQLVDGTGHTFYFTMNVREGAGNFGTSQGTIFGCVSNSIAITSCIIQGPGGTPLSTPSGQYDNNLPTTANQIALTGYRTQLYIYPQGLQWNQNYQFTVQITTSTAFNANDVVNVFMNDKVNYLLNGQVIATPVNPVATGTDLGQAVVNEGFASGSVQTVNSLGYGGAISLLKTR